MTQEQLSLETGIMQSHLSEIEAGKRNASVDVIGTIAKALGIQVAMLFDDRSAQRLVRRPREQRQ